MNNICPKCGKKMIIESEIFSGYSSADLFRRYWCGCGFKGDWEDYLKWKEIILQNEWLEINK